MNTISTGIIGALILGLLICFLLPIVGFIYSRIRYKKIAKPFLFGMLTFFVSQIVLRLPIIQVLLPKFDWYNIFVAKYYYLYVILLALSAGVFEEVGRFLVVKYFLKKNRRYGDGIAFGIGHGGIEAILIVGMSYINMLVYSLASNKGTLEALLNGAPQTAIDSVNAALAGLSIAGVLLGALERVFAMAMHIGMTMIVYMGFAKKKEGTYLLVAILVHTMVDSLCGILPKLGISGGALEVVFGACAALLLWYTLRMKRPMMELTQ